MRINNELRKTLVDWFNRLSQILIVAFIVTPIVTKKTEIFLVSIGFLSALAALIMALYVASTVKVIEEKNVYE
jgi:hypothetical protein